MVILASDFDKSKYLKAADLGSEKKLRIKSVSVEEVGTEKKERKPILWFTNDEHGLVLNITNLRTCSGAFGDNMEAWANKIIIVFPTMVDMRGKMVPALRVRIPPPKQATGNGSTAEAPAAKPEAPPVKKTIADDMDDEIPFVWAATAVVPLLTLLMNGAGLRMNGCGGLQVHPGSPPHHHKEKLPWVSTAK